jgi:PAS domain S-box-containing protein
VEKKQPAGLSWAYELYRISQDVGNEGQERVREKILECIVAGTSATTGTVALLDERGDRLTIAAGIGRSAQFVGTGIALGEEVLGWVAQHGTPLLLNGDCSSDPRFRGRQRQGDTGPRPSAMCFPLKIEKRVIGALSLNRKPGDAPFTQQDLDETGAVVQVASLVLDNAGLRAAQQQRIAELDAANRSLEMAQARRRDSEARLAAILENTTDLICTTDLDGRLLTMNRAGRGMLGLAEAQPVEGLSITDFYAPWSVAQFHHETRPYTLRDGDWSGESEMQAAMGREFPVLQLMQVHRPADGAPAFLSVSIRDITEQKQHEEELRARLRELEEAKARIEQTQSQLLQSDKMASIGQLAAGVAHEINNPVGYVNSNLGTLQRYLADLFRVLDAYATTEAELPAESAARVQLQETKQSVDLGFLRDDVQQLVKESQDGLKRVKQIVQDLKDFSHVDEAEWQWTDLHGGLDSTLNIVHNEIKYKAEVVKHYGELPQVECLPSQLNQVFMNMLVNAAHAIEARGTITIASGRQGEEVWVDIADTGKGISPQNLKRVFDPFFTTKPVGKGTGLGLSLSYGIVQKHHGRIEVKSEVGKGTTFRIWLPVKQAETKAAA